MSEWVSESEWESGEVSGEVSGGQQISQELSVYIHFNLATFSLLYLEILF